VSTGDKHGASSGDDSIAVEEHFDCSQTELWSALVDGQQLSAWFGGTCAIEAMVGGAVHFDLPDDGVQADGLVRACDPPTPGNAVAQLEHTFIDRARPDLTSVCRWSVVQADSGCDLYFSMDGAGELSGVWGRLTEDEGQYGISQEEALAAFASADTVLLVDWVGPETPTVIAATSPLVYGKIGPNPDDWAVIEPEGSSFKVTRQAAAPDHVDLLHLDWTLGFDEFLQVGRALGAKTFWYHSARTRPPAPADNRGVWVPRRQSERQRKAVEDAGMTYIDNHNIADIARLYQTTR
jgi:hypothetical protein